MNEKRCLESAPASLATSLPLCTHDILSILWWKKRAYLPIAIAMSLAFIAGASLTPSPVYGKTKSTSYKKGGEGGTYDSDDIIASLLRLLHDTHLLLRSSSRKHDFGIFTEDDIPGFFRKLLHVVASQNYCFYGIIISWLHLRRFAHRRRNFRSLDMSRWLTPRVCCPRA